MAAIIYPENPLKYKGTVCVAKGKFDVRIHNGISMEYKLFDDKEEAEAYKMQRCSELGLVKNLMKDYDGHYEMELTKGKSTKIDRSKFPEVDAHIWGATNHRNNSYAYSESGGYLHHFVLNFKPRDGLTVDHINRDTLDNRAENLRIVDRTTQIINQNIRKDNTSGVKGIYYSKNEKAWKAQWSEEGQTRVKTFSIKKHGDDARRLAEEFRKNKEEGLPAYALALNH